MAMALPKTKVNAMTSAASSIRGKADGRSRDQDDSRLRGHSRVDDEAETLGVRLF